MPVKGCRGSEVDDRHLNGSGLLNHQCYMSAGLSIRWLVGPSVGPSVRHTFIKIDEKFPFEDSK